MIPCWILYHYREGGRRFWAGLIIILAVAPFIASLSSYVAYLITGLGIVTFRLPFIGIGVLLFVFTFAATNTEHVASAEQLAEWSEHDRWLSMLLIVAALVSAFVSATSLPANIVSDSYGLKNIVAHGAGIIFRMLVAITLRYTSKKPVTEQAAQTDP